MNQPETKVSTVKKMGKGHNDTIQRNERGRVKAYEEILNLVSESVMREMKIKVIQTYPFKPILMKIKYHPELPNAYEMRSLLNHRRVWTIQHLSGSGVAKLGECMNSLE